MSGSISQMQMLYKPEEDRILFRVNSTDKKEFRFWVTRRYSILLLKILKDHMDADPDISMQGSPDAKQAIKSFKQEKAMAEANFKEEFKEDANELPLGEEVQLAFKLTYNIQKENLHLGIQPQSGQGINMVINRQINTTLVQLILGAARKGEWCLENLTGADLLRKDNRVIN